MVLYSAADLDVARPVFRLTVDEADALAQILGAPRIARRFADLTREVPGLDMARCRSAPAARMSTGRWGHPARTRSGASIVAIVRDEEVLPSPGPAEPLRAGDIPVVIGTADGIRRSPRSWRTGRKGCAGA